MHVINFFAGPGAGKSTRAAELFAQMKHQGYNVELVDEYAKELTWEGHVNILEDQVMCLAMQNRKLARLKDKVDFVITDSPLLLTRTYAPENYFPGTFPAFVNQLFRSYQNINFFVEREDRKFKQVGRVHNADQSKDLDRQIKLMLYEDKYEFLTVDSKPDPDGKILKHVMRFMQNGGTFEPSTTRSLSIDTAVFKPLNEFNTSISSPTQRVTRDD